MACQHTAVAAIPSVSECCGTSAEVTAHSPCNSANLNSRATTVEEHRAGSCFIVATNFYLKLVMLSTVMQGKMTERNFHQVRREIRLMQQIQ